MTMLALGKLSSTRASSEVMACSCSEHVHSATTPQAGNAVKMHLAFLLMQAAVNELQQQEERASNDRKCTHIGNDLRVCCSGSQTTSDWTGKLTLPGMGALTGLPPSASRIFLPVMVRVPPPASVTLTVCWSLSFPRPSAYARCQQLCDSVSGVHGYKYTPPEPQKYHD